MRAYGLAWRQRPELGRVRPVGRRVGQGCGACQRSLVRCGAGSWRRRTACPGRRLAGPDRVGLPAGGPERHRPARLDGDLGRLPLVGGGAVELLAALGLAEAASLRSGRPVVRCEAVASPAGVSCLEGPRLMGSTVWPAMTCVWPSSARRVRPRGGSRPRTWQMTRTTSVTR